MDEEKMKEREDASDGWTDLLDSGQLFRKVQQQVYFNAYRWLDFVGCLRAECQALKF